MEAWPVEQHVFVYDAFVKRRAVAPLALPIFQRVIFFFRQYLKSRAYAHKPRTLNDLKETICQEIRLIDRQLLARVVDDLKKKA